MLDERQPRSYFMDKIFPSLVTAALAAGFGVIGMYFAINALSSRVGAIEETYVRQDVLTPQLGEINKKLDKQDTKLDRLLEREEE